MFKDENSLFRLIDDSYHLYYILMLESFQNVDFSVESLPDMRLFHSVLFVDLQSNRLFRLFVNCIFDHSTWAFPNDMANWEIIEQKWRATTQLWRIESFLSKTNNFGWPDLDYLESGWGLIPLRRLFFSYFTNYTALRSEFFEFFHCLIISVIILERIRYIFILSRKFFRMNHEFIRVTWVTRRVNVDTYCRMLLRTVLVDFFRPCRSSRHFMSVNESFLCLEILKRALSSSGEKFLFSVFGVESREVRM